MSYIFSLPWFAIILSRTQSPTLETHFIFERATHLKMKCLAMVTQIQCSRFFLSCLLFCCTVCTCKISLYSSMIAVSYIYVIYCSVLYLEFFHNHLPLSVMLIYVLIVRIRERISASLREVNTCTKMKHLNLSVCSICFFRIHDWYFCCKLRKVTE